MATSYGLVRSVAPAPSACPEEASGKSYLGVYVDHGAKVVYAYLYADGAYVSTLGSLAYTGIYHSIRTDAVFWRLSGDRIVFAARRASADGQPLIVTWEPSTGTRWTAETDTATHSYTYNPVPISDTEALAAIDTDGNELEFYRFPLATDIGLGAWPGHLEATVAFDSNQGFTGPLVVTGSTPKALHGGFDFSQSERSRWFGFGQDDVPEVPEGFKPAFDGDNPVGGHLVTGGALIGSDADGDGAAQVGLGVLSGAGVYTRWTPAVWGAGLGSIARVAPTPSGDEYVALLGDDSFVRLPVGAIGAECPLHKTAIEPGPADPGAYPSHFFARD
jgi:hypothetical protein